MSWPGLPRRRVDQVRQPGVPATAPGSSNVVRARYVIVSGPGDGVFIYQAGTTPGLGNPPIAWSTSGTVDPYGNVLPSSGVGSQFPGGAAAWSALTNGGISFKGGNSIIGSPSGNMVFTTAATFQFVGGPIESTAGTDADPTLITTDTWHDLRPLNTGFTGSVAGYWPPQYQLNALGSVELFGAVGLPSTGFNSVTWGTVAPTWCPAVQTFIHVDMISNAGAAPGNSQGQYLEVATNGALQFHGLPSGGGAGPVVFSGSWPLSSGPITS